MEAKISWLGTPESRIISIRKFRKYIDNLPFDEAVDLTKKNWESGPRINKPQFDIHNVNDWPTPWDLYSQQVFCKDAQFLGIFYTLLLSNHAKQHKISLAIVNDVIFGETSELIFDDQHLTDYPTLHIIRINDVRHKLGV